MYWNNIPSPYMVERFNALASRCEFDFEAWFNDRREGDRSWAVDESTWQFPYRYTATTQLMRRKQHWPIWVLGKKPDVLVSLYAEPCFLFGWFIAKLRGVKTIFWCQVTSSRWVVRRGWKELAKKMIFPHLEATLGSGEQSRRFAMQYGVAGSRALVLRHSIDVEHYARGARLTPRRYSAKRRELGLQGTTFLYVGRLWWGKGLPILLNAFEQVQRRGAVEVSLLLVGDGPEEKALRRTCEDRGIRNVVFAGFQQKAQLPIYYAVSDVFVFPTLGDPYGLVVDEAMACSLPVISTSGAGEIADRLEDGVNGYVIPPGDSDALAARMMSLEEDVALRRRMGRASFAKIQGHTPERWAEDFEYVVLSVLER